MRNSMHIRSVPDKDGRKFVDLQIRDDELRAFGHVMVQWSFLEFLILRESRRLAQRSGQALPRACLEVALSRRCDAWEELAHAALDGTPEITRALALVSETRHLATERHRLTHNLIEIDPIDQNRLKAFPRTTPTKVGWPLDAKRIEQTAHETARLNWAILSLFEEPPVAHGASPRKRDLPSPSGLELERVRQNHRESKRTIRKHRQ